MGDYHENAEDHWVRTESEGDVQSGRVEMVTVKAESEGEQNVYVEEVPIEKFTVTDDGELVINLDFNSL